MFKIIAAPATAPGIAGVSMVRVSGEGCTDLVDKIFQGKKKLAQKKSHEIAYGKIIDPTNSRLIDEVMIAVFAHGQSFTGEESLEIWTHGSPYIVKEVMRILSSLGIGTADPGEFSMRAFLNGKIDLTQAEAIKDLTESQTKFAHAQAIGRLEGGLSSKIDNIHTQVLDVLALLETAIDHAEEEVDVDELGERYELLLNKIFTDINSLISGAKTGKMSTDGIKITLVGRPNVGKSSLLNALVKENRVIVSDIAGTTRDVIEHRIASNGLLMRFFDTAGLRETDDVLEKEGTKRSLQAIENADIVLHILDITSDLQDEDIEIQKLLNSKQKYFLTIFNKCDLEKRLTRDMIDNDYNKIIEVSAFEQEGLEKVFDAIAEFYFAGGVDPENDVFVANIRQENLLYNALNSLESAKKSLDFEESEEFVVSHIRQARVYLELIVGKTTDDAILDRIFSQFCIGK